MNAIINTMLLRLQEVPGVLTCRHRFISVSEGGLDPLITTYIADARLEGLLQVPNIDLNHALITTLVERWRLETHSFYLPYGEMIIMLQDMEVIMGVLVDGLPVVGFALMQDWGNLCAKLLRHRLPNKQVSAGKNTAKWLEGGKSQMAQGAV